MSVIKDILENITEFYQYDLGEFFMPTIYLSCGLGFFVGTTFISLILMLCGVKFGA